MFVVTLWIKIDYDPLAQQVSELVYFFPLVIKKLDEVTPISKSQHTKEKQQWLHLITQQTGHFY